MDVKGQRGSETEENKKGGKVEREGLCVLGFVQDGTCGCQIKREAYCLFCH